MTVIAKATINGKEVSKPAMVTDVVKAGLNGLPFPPREMLTSSAGSSATRVGYSWGWRSAFRRW